MERGNLRYVPWHPTSHTRQKWKTILIHTSSWLTTSHSSHRKKALKEDLLVLDISPDRMRGRGVCTAAAAAAAPGRRLVSVRCTVRAASASRLWRNLNLLESYFWKQVKNPISIDTRLEYCPNRPKWPSTGFPNLFLPEVSGWCLNGSCAPVKMAILGSTQPKKCGRNERTHQKAWHFASCSLTGLSVWILTFCLATGRQEEGCVCSLRAKCDQTRDLRIISGFSQNGPGALWQ